jgi:hypothetical protein
MKKEIEVFNLNHCNPTISTIKSKLVTNQKVWVGFNESRYFVLDINLLEQFIRNYQLNDDDLIEEIFL